MKNFCISKLRIILDLLLILLLNIFMYSSHGQESHATGIPSRDEVQLHVIESGNPWRPPFGIDRIGRSFDVIVVFQSRELLSGEYLLAGYLDCKEVSRKTLHFVNKTPFTIRMHTAEAENQSTLFSVSNHAKKDIAFAGRPLFTEKIDQLALLFTGNGKDTIELARQAIKLKDFEAEVVARPDKVINPVDLGAILVPYDWLLLAGGQKANVTVAGLKRTSNISNSRITAWYCSAPKNKVIEPLSLTQGSIVKKEMTLPPCSKSLETDTLRVSIEDAEGKELWHKQIIVMIVPDPPVLPSFGAIKTKLRYDSPVINIVDGKNVPLDYDELWKPEFEDVVVCLPNGSRWVFWRGTSYIPIWAGKYNTCLSYEWAERISPNIGFTDCPEPLMDKELRYSRVEIVESTSARIHIRWSYQLQGQWRFDSGRLLFLSRWIWNSCPYSEVNS
jgi:hypothetical protein